MIKEAYCSFEVSELLKEKGFDGLCSTAYETITSKHNVEEVAISNWGKLNQIRRPTHQMAMAWLREEKNIIVNVWYNGVDWNAEYYNNEDENFYLITDCTCNSYEEAVEIALKYILNII